MARKHGFCRPHVGGMAAIASTTIKEGVGWTPLVLGSDLLAWWDAGAGISLSGSSVTAWADRKGGYLAEQSLSGSRPLWSETSFNGAPGVTFDGNDDEVTCTAAALLAALPTGAAAGELWLVGQQSELAVSGSITKIAMAYGGADGFSRRAIGRGRPSTVNRALVSVGVSGLINTPTDETVDFSSRHLVRGVIGNGATIYVDGGPGTSVAGASTTSAARLRLGSSANTAASAFWKGLIRDAIFTLPLSTEKAALMQTWGLTRRML